MPNYNPPILNTRVTLRNPSEKPQTKRDRYGREIPSSEHWGVEIFAARKDLTAKTLYEEQLTVNEGTTVWTVRHRTIIDSDAEIVEKGIIYESVGPPRLMGGVNYGLRGKFFEIRTIRRA